MKWLKKLGFALLGDFALIFSFGPDHLTLIGNIGFFLLGVWLWTLADKLFD